MFYKRQRSSDFIIGRVCLLANEVAAFNDHDSQENIHWVYLIDGSVNIQCANNEFNDTRTISDQLVDLRNNKTSFFKFLSNNKGSTFLLFITELDTPDQYTCKKLTVDKEIFLSTADNKQIIVPLVSDLEIKKTSASSFKKIPTTASVTLPTNTELIFRSSTVVKSHALLFTKIS